MKTKKTIFLVLFIIFLSAGVAFGSYAYKKNWDYAFKSEEFYFFSDYLSPDTLENHNYYWEGESVYFNLKNSQNKSLVTKDEIFYEIKCTVIEPSDKPVTCNFLNTNKDEIEGSILPLEYCKNSTNDGINVEGYNKINCEASGYTWVTEESVSDVYFNIVTESSDVKVLIEAVSKKPYKKEIKGLFHLKKITKEPEDIFLYVDNLLDYSLVKFVNTYASDKCINIKWNNYKIDATDKDIKNEVVDSSGYINEVNVKISKNSSKVLKFFESENAKEVDFLVDTSGVCE